MLIVTSHSNGNSKNWKLSRVFNYVPSNAVEVISETVYTVDRLTDTDKNKVQKNTQLNKPN